jgi:hypothetical protein
MTNCTFHPERSSTAELGVDEPRVGGRVALFLCEECLENYDEACEEHRQAMEEA